MQKLKSQCPSLYIPANGSEQTSDDSLLDEITPRNDSGATSMMDMSRMVAQLTQAVVSARERVSVLLQKLHPLREKMVMLKDDYEEKKKSYNVLQTTLNSEIALTQSEINESENSVKNLEKTWNHLQVGHHDSASIFYYSICIFQIIRQTIQNRNRVLLEKAEAERETSGSNKSTLKTTLTEQIQEQENFITSLQEVTLSPLHHDDIRRKVTGSNVFLLGNESVERRPQ